MVEEMGTLGRAIYSVGNWIRGTGQAIDRLGSLLQGGYYVQEQRLSLSPFSFSSFPCPNFSNIIIILYSMIHVYDWRVI